MKITGKRHIAAPQLLVESVLENGRQLTQAISNFELRTPLDGQRQRGTLTVPSGPMRGQYESIFTVTRPSPAIWEISYDGHSAQGIFQGYGRIHLTTENEQTLLHYEGSIEVTGRLADLPPRLLHANVNAIIRRSLEGIDRILWPEKFVIAPEPDAGSPRWLKTAVPAALAVVGVFLFIRFLNKRLP